MIPKQMLIDDLRSVGSDIDMSEAGLEKQIELAKSFGAVRALLELLQPSELTDLPHDGDYEALDRALGGCVYEVGGSDEAGAAILDAFVSAYRDYKY